MDEDVVKLFLKLLTEFAIGVLVVVAAMAFASGYFLRQW